MGSQTVSLRFITILLAFTLACSLGACSKRLATRAPGGRTNTNTQNVPGAPAPVQLPPATPQQPGQPFSIVGNWTSACLSDCNGNVYIATLNYTATNFTYSWTSWAGTECNTTEPTDYGNYTGTYTLVQTETATGSGMHNVDLTYDDDGSTLYTVVRVDNGTTLYMGDVSGTPDGSSADQRATALNTYEVYSGQVTGVRSTAVAGVNPFAR